VLQLLLLRKFKNLIGIEHFRSHNRNRLISISMFLILIFWKQWEWESAHQKLIKHNQIIKNLAIKF